MSRLNGVYEFYYSKEQEEELEDQDKTFVKDDEKFKQYTEAVYSARVDRNEYTPHKERYEDSEKVAKLLNPIIKRGVLLNGKKAKD